MRVVRMVLANLLLTGLMVLPSPAANAGELDDLSWASVSVEAKGLAYDATSGLLLVTVGENDPTYPNRLVAIDPTTLLVEWSAYVGADPNVVAVSDDGSAVYVGLDSTHSIARFDPESQTVTGTMALPTSSYGPLPAADIAVAPGEPGLVAVTTRKRIVAIFDDGTLLPDMTGNGGDSIEFGATADVLYGQETNVTGFYFTRMSVSETGVEIDDFTSKFGDGKFHNAITYLDGLIYYTHGQVIDPTTLQLLGSYKTDRTIAAVAPLPSRGRTMTISGTPSIGRYALSVFDIDGFGLVDQVMVEPGIGNGPGSSVAIGDSGIAVQYEEGLYIAGFFARGTIAGTVTDSQSGEPISEVCVFATDPDTYIVGYAETNEDGSYNLRVAPGEWHVLFGDCNYSDYFWEWHSNQVFYDLDAATPVSVSEDRTVTVNAALNRTVADSLDSIFQEQIWWMYDTGITTGCGPGAYCPDSTVTRGQMAAFLVRALGLTSTSAVDFVDDNASIFENDINKLATAGITKGCNPPTNNQFCPDQSVTRGQMAAFLVRALELNATSDIDFLDDNGDVFETAINKLATAGITKGCNPPTNDKFCPNQAVTRGQMAAFLNRALKGEYTLGLPATDARLKVPIPRPSGPQR